MRWRHNSRVAMVVMAWSVVVASAGEAAGPRDDGAQDSCRRFRPKPPREGPFTCKPDHPSTYSPPADLNTTSFVVLSLPRSASSSIVQVLNSHPLIQMKGEEFHFNAFPSSFGNYGWSLERRESNRTEFMRVLFEQTAPPAKPRARARGFKIFDEYLAESELVRLTSPSHVVKIVLLRRDSLSQYVSFLREQDVRRRHPTDREAASLETRRKVFVCVDKYREYVARKQLWYDWLAAEASKDPGSWLFIYTEDLITTPQPLYDIYDRLHLPRGAVLNYGPQTTDVLEEKVINYDEIKFLIANDTSAARRA